ncbi:MFS transporter [Clostridium autoethanogenum]|uniref:MFS transporter n=1 Tax=Clostridium autoethanogenum TaxID=84023 RepID=A0A3M0S6B3_9CLOT|nr:MFS transporter [Clostridium autoethanogenum]RMC93913.1 MFS transporter [Clostridium autoethanogenum]
MDKPVKDTMNELNLVENSKINKKFSNKIWNRNFTLLFQGQAVSILGDNVFNIALEFWVLMRTGSVSLMGTLLAVITLPKVFISPFAGTFIDRHDRKKVLITTDVISGITILFIGITAIIDSLQVWMVFISGLITGVCSCFFYPTINSCIPDIIPKSKLLKANSILSSISSVNDMIGYAFGGFLVQIVGAPILFIFNGLSFLFSATLEYFAQIPQIKSSLKNINFIEDMKIGIHLVNKLKGFKYIYITIAFLNLFASMSMTLTLPWFKINNQLGVGLYGIAMAINTFGIFVGYTILSVFEMKKENKFYVFIISGIIISCTMIIYSMTLNFYFIAVMFFIDGLCLAVMGSLLQTSMQNFVPSDMRSKVFAFENALSSALMPIGMIFAGILGARIQMNKIIFADYAIFLVLFIYLSFLRCVKETINI